MSVICAKQAEPPRPSDLYDARMIDIFVSVHRKRRKNRMKDRLEKKYEYSTWLNDNYSRLLYIFEEESDFPSSFEDFIWFVYNSIEENPFANLEY